MHRPTLKHPIVVTQPDPANRRRLKVQLFTEAARGWFMQQAPQLGKLDSAASRGGHEVWLTVKPYLDAEDVRDYLLSEYAEQREAEAVG